MQFLSTSLAPFSPALMSASTLQKLIEQSATQHFGVSQPEVTLYEAHKPYHFFILIVKGK